MQRGAGTEEVCREKGWRAGRTGGSGDGLVIKSMGGKRGSRAGLGRERGAQGWATAGLSHCMPASASWAFPQVGTAPGILARDTALGTAFRDTPLFQGGSRGCLSAGCSAWGKLFHPEVPAPASAANKIFVLASKGWPGVLCSFHAGWEADPNFFIVTVVNHLGLDAVSSPFLFQPFSLHLCFLCSFLSLAPSLCSIFLDFFGWFSISTRLEG